MSSTKPPNTRPESSRELDPGSLSQLQLIQRSFAKHRLAVAACSLLVVFYFVAVAAEFFAIAPPNQRDVTSIHCPPTPIRFDFTHGLHLQEQIVMMDPITLRRTYTAGEGVIDLGLLAAGEPYRLAGLIPLRWRLIGVVEDDIARANPDAPARFYPLGADRYGRCIYSRVVHGGRVSLSVGLIGVMLTFLFGTLIGGASGLLGGTTDTVIQRIIEIVQSVPALPLWIALGASLPPDWSPLQSYFAITIVLSLLGWTGLARVVRGKILSLREEDYAVAARLLGASEFRLLVRHLLPGFASHIIVALTLAVPAMILGETALSFLGLGLRPPVVSWGVMLQDCLDVKAVRFFPWLLTPAAFIVATVLAFNFAGDGLRDATDPYGGR